MSEQQESYEDFLSNVPVFTGQVMPQQDTATDIISTGGTMLQTRTQYHTAVSVQKPRNLDKVVSNVMNEARFAGEDWYYAWTVKGKDGNKLVEGGSIGLATSLMREWTNCVIDVAYEERGGIDIFTTSFIDIETGTTFNRVFRQKRKAAVGRYDADRWEDMEFQKAQSKAIRNVVLAAMPKWLQKAAIAEAKKGIISAIERVGLAKSRQMAVDFLAGYGVDIQQIESLLKKKQDLWTTEEVAKLRGIASRLKDGQDTPESIFPPKVEAQTAPPPVAEEPKKTRKKPADSTPAEKLFVVPPPNCPYTPDGEAKKSQCVNEQCYTDGSCTAWGQREPGSDG